MKKMPLWKLAVFILAMGSFSAYADDNTLIAREGGGHEREHEGEHAHGNEQHHGAEAHHYNQEHSNFHGNNMNRGAYNRGLETGATLNQGTEQPVYIVPDQPPAPVQNNPDNESS